MMYDITFIKDAVREIKDATSANSIELKEIKEKLNDISLRLARIDAKKGK